MEKKSRLTHDQRTQRRKRMAAEVSEGATIVEVALKYGVSDDLVRIACHQNQVELQKTQQPHLNTYKVIAGLLAGKRGPELAREFKVTESRISQVRRKCKDAGIVLPQPPPRSEGTG